MSLKKDREYLFIYEGEYKPSGFKYSVPFRVWESDKNEVIIEASDLLAIKQKIFITWRVLKKDFILNKPKLFMALKSENKMLRMLAQCMLEFEIEQGDIVDNNGTHSDETRNTMAIAHMIKEAYGDDLNPRMKQL